MPDYNTDVWERTIQKAPLNCYMTPTICIFIVGQQWSNEIEAPLSDLVVLFFFLLINPHLLIWVENLCARAQYDKSLSWIKIYQ